MLQNGPSVMAIGRGSLSSSLWALSDLHDR
jgi:hypothetical protein